MDIKQFEEVVKRTAKSCETQEIDGQTLNVLHWSLGLSGEVGELVDTVKKHVFYKQPFDMVNAEEELGDILFYAVAMINELGLNTDYVMATLDAKLNQRYPEGYSDTDAKERKDKQMELFTEDEEV